MSEDQFDAVTFGTIDPLRRIDGKPIPAMTSLLFEVCNNDTERFDAAMRLVRLFCDKAFELGAQQ
ncbi:MAG: hypothetical protein K2Y20_13895 [Sphingomonas sp.]|nr:hypothetical protein [Sphingomonas sp.]